MHEPTPFGVLPDSRPAMLYTLENAVVRVRLTDYGGRIVSILAPNRAGRRDEILLGFDDAAAYAAAGGAFGALLGRNANRIAGGDLTIDGKRHRLATNDRGATLHGGPGGFDQVLWRVETVTASEVTLAFVSPDGDQGFPGELTVTASYRLDGATLALEFSAHTTRPTIASLSAHPYFNLADGAADIFGHDVTIAADAFLPTDEKQIPTGDIRPVAETPFDFRRPTRVGARIRQADRQLLHGQGYDHCYVLNGEMGALRFAARACDLASGRTVEVHTTQPAMQFYSGNQLNGSIAGRGGVTYRQSAALAFEPQGFPDAPHHTNFPSTVLRPGETYREIIEYRFGIA